MGFGPIFCLREALLYFENEGQSAFRAMRRYLKLEEIIEPPIQSLGCKLVGLEYSTGRSRDLLRVYVEKMVPVPEQKGSGIMTEDCVRLMQAIEAALNVAQCLTGDYILEVSSPGMDRILFTVEQMQAHVQHCVSVKMKILVEGKRNFKGRLLAVAHDMIQLQLDEAVVSLKTDDIEQARLVPIW